MPTGDGLFRKNGSPYWYFYMPVGNGTYRQVSTKRENYAEAKVVKNRALEEAREGTHPDETAKMKLGKAIEDFVAYRMKAKGIRTAKAERSRLKAVERILGPDTRLENIPRSALERYQVARLDEGVKASSINSELKALRYILKRARLWNRFRDNYQQLSVPRQSPRQAITPEQLKLIVATAQNKKRWQVALWGALVSVNTTARRYEVISLRLKDICLPGDEQCLAPHLKIYREGTKTDAGVRVLPLNGTALWAVQQLLERAKSKGAANPEHYLFPALLSRHTKKDDPLYGRRGYDPTRHQESWQSAWESLREAAGLPSLHYHDLRHTAITNGRKQGVLIDKMRRLAGHSTDEMTDYYTHLGSGDLIEAVDKIERGNPDLLRILGIGAVAIPSTAAD